MKRSTARLLIALAIGALACLPLAAQDWGYTVFERTPGERALKLSGILVDADTAYLQLYHDGKVLHDGVILRTWDITLGTEDYYIVKFTDARGREKYLYIVELSDNLTEFYLPLEIDFARGGNLLLLKQSDGKPHYQEFDVGLSRKRHAHP